MRAERERAVVEHGVAGHPERHMAAARRHAVAARGNADDQLVHQARRAPAGWPRRDRRRSSAARRSPPRGHAARRRRRPLRTPAGPAPASPRSCPQARHPCPRSPATPAPAARSRAGRRAKRPACPGPCRPRPRPIAAPPPARAPASVPAISPNRRRNSPSCGVMIASWPLSRSGSPRCVMASASITLGALRRQRQRQHLRDVAHARARPAGIRSARR